MNLKYVKDTDDMLMLIPVESLEFLHPEEETGYFSFQIVLERTSTMSTGTN